MSKRFCYWSVATGPYAALMEQCVESARRAGVFKEFHVLTDRPIAGCECYDAQTLEHNEGFFKLIYLKAGISKLNFDYFVWIDADTLFAANPVDLLDCLGMSPLHVPLLENLSECGEDGPSCSPGPRISAKRYAAVMAKAGIYNPVYYATSSFWVVHRDAIGTLCALTSEFRQALGNAEFVPDFSMCLSFAMQLLCANPEIHTLEARPSLWAEDSAGAFDLAPPDHSPWEWTVPVSGRRCLVNPCIVHVPRRRRLTRPVPACEPGGEAALAAA